MISHLLFNFSSSLSRALSGVGRSPVSPHFAGDRAHSLVEVVLLIWGARKRKLASNESVAVYLYAASSEILELCFLFLK